MASGRDLTTTRVHDAMRFNRGRFERDFLRVIQNKMGLPETGESNEDFVRAVADWQEANLAVGAGDGKVGPNTESMLNILLPEAQAAADAATRLVTRGGVLFDSWGNDARDNNLDGVVDDAHEQRASDGEHFHGSFPSFRVVAGTFTSGYPGRPTGTVTISTTEEIHGPFRYRVCADMVSEAYHVAGIMRHKRRVREIVEQFHHIGRIWHRNSDRYPTRYLPGDLIAVLDHGEGHCGMVVAESDTNGGDDGPTAFELPGPSWEFSDGTYNPRTTNDAKIQQWRRHTFNTPEQQLMCRVLRSRFHSHST